MDASQITAWKDIPEGSYVRVTTRTANPLAGSPLRRQNGYHEFRVDRKSFASNYGAVGHWTLSGPGRVSGGYSNAGSSTHVNLMRAESFAQFEILALPGEPAPF